MHPRVARADGGVTRRAEVMVHCRILHDRAAGLALTDPQKESPDRPPAAACHITLTTRCPRKCMCVGCTAAPRSCGASCRRSGSP